MSNYYEIRDPIHGFIKIDEWERDIINHPVFQRLRRIRQLGLTDMVYPGALHTRFEHSLGVMHVATRMFDHIRVHCGELLKNDLHYDENGLEKDRTIVRLSSLLHDVGHAPFSHASEGLMDKEPISDQAYKHENYSAAVVKFLMKDVIEDHPINLNYDIKINDISDFLDGNPQNKRRLLWRDLIVGQLDADRADYLLRDSRHIGVAYGSFDLERLIATLTVAIDPEDNSAKLAVEEGGEHAAEALILARYMMFTQVYFQHTRRAYDYHLREAIAEILSNSETGNGLPAKRTFPPPTSEESMKKYLEWDDWLVAGKIKSGEAGMHGRAILERKHDRCIFSTPEIPDEKDLERFDKVKNRLGDKLSFTDQASSSWYKFQSADIPLLLHPGQGPKELTALSKCSTVVKGLKTVNRTRIYVPLSKKTASDKIVNEAREKWSASNE